MFSKLVFTVALKEELPLNWLKSLDICIYSLKALKAGALKGGKGVNGKKSILFVISGVGKGAAREAALWIRKNVKPLFVVNIGTAGAINHKTGLREWVVPEVVSNEAGERLLLDSRMPFPWPESISRFFGGELLTIEKARFGDIPPEFNRFQYLDMECYAQAEVFAGTGTTFHTVKWISDFSDNGGREQFQRALTHFRQALKDILAFLKRVEEPHISVIIPVFNRKRWIAPCVESVLTQSLPPKEVIIVDDGSDDGTINALKSYKERVRVLVQKKNKGVSSARNLGALKSASPWICFLDADDLWHEEKLKRQWEFLKANPFYEIFQCGELWIRNGRRVNPCKHHEKPEGWIWKQSLSRCLITPSAVMMSRNVFMKTGGFDESLPVCEDYDLWLRISRGHVVGLEPSLSVIKHGGHKDQLSGKFTAIDSFRVKALLKALEKENNPEYRAEIIKKLKYKLNILIKGSKKRMKYDKCEEYEAALSRL